jgi:putative restriction endonuclease
MLRRNFSPVCVQTTWAHIMPYMGPATNDVQNGLLLRADVHTLFDLGLIAVEPDPLEVLVTPSVVGTHWGRPLRLRSL